MGHGPTRAALAVQLTRTNEEIQRLARERDMLQKEIDYAHQSTDLARAALRQVTSDRERLTGVVEILARRLASEGVNQASDRLIGGTAFEGMGKSTRMDQADPTARYPKH